MGKQWDWRGHDELFGLVFDLLQDEEQAVAKMRTRLEKVKAELRELGEEVEDEELGEGAGSGGGGGGNLGLRERERGRARAQNRHTRTQIQKKSCK